MALPVFLTIALAAHMASTFTQGIVQILFSFVHVYTRNVHTVDAWGNFQVKNISSLNFSRGFIFVPYTTHVLDENWHRWIFTYACKYTCNYMCIFRWQYTL